MCGILEIVQVTHMWLARNEDGLVSPQTHASEFGEEAL